MPAPVDILKGDRFAARLREIFREPLPHRPLPDVKHRRVLIPGLLGGELQFALLGFIGQALRIRGAEVTALMCDELLPACTLRKVDHHESACTRWCHRNAPRFAAAVNLPHRWYSELITQDEKREARAFVDAVADAGMAGLRYRDIELQEHVLRSLESYFKVGHCDLDDPVVAAKSREFLLAAVYLVEISHRAFDELKIDKVLIDDGKKTDWGVLRDVAARRGIPVDVIGIAHRGTSVRFEIDRPPHRTRRMPQWERWRDVPLTDAQDRELDAYLERRATTPFDNRGDEWRGRTVDPGELRRALGLPDDPPGLVFGMFPNLGFDAGKTSTSPAYAAAPDWIADTVGFLGSHPQHHLVIKAHPAELHRQAQDPVFEQLTGRFDAIPANVHFVDSGAGLSAHSVVGICDVVLVYTSTVGAEAAALGKPVVLVGGGWNAHRGITIDVATPGEYLELLGRLCDGHELPETTTSLARRYAYALFFRSAIPIRHLSVHGLHVSALHPSGVSDLAPGRDPSLDAICRGILLDEPFENPHADGPAATPCATRDMVTTGRSASGCT